MPEPNGEEAPTSRTPQRVSKSIDWAADKGLLIFEWQDSETTVLDLSELPQNIQTDLMYWGLIARCQQAYVMAKGSPKVAREKAGKLWEQLKSGDWGLRRGEQSYSITVRALAVLLKTSEAEAQARFAALPVDKRREVSSRSDVVAQVAKLKAKANPLQSLDQILK